MPKRRRSTKRKAPAKKQLSDPKSPKRRKQTDISTLDLHRSYEDEWEGPLQKPEGPQRKIWRWEVVEPCMDWDKVPEGRTDLDLDIDWNDIEGNIKRRHERFAKRILPLILENRQEAYEELQAKREYVLKP